MIASRPQKHEFDSEWLLSIFGMPPIQTHTHGGDDGILGARDPVAAPSSPVDNFMTNNNSVWLVKHAMPYKLRIHEERRHIHWGGDGGALKNLSLFLSLSVTPYAPSVGSFLPLKFNSPVSRARRVSRTNIYAAKVGAIQFTTQIPGRHTVDRRRRRRRRRGAQILIVTVRLDCSCLTCRSK